MIKTLKSSAALKGFILLIFFVWISSALGLAANIEIQRKSECVENEGLIKGWLWCKTDDTSRFTGMNFTLNTISELRWPFHFADNKTPMYRTKEFNSPDSRLPSMFICGAIGSSTGIAPDAMELVSSILLSTGSTSPEQFDLWLLDTQDMLTTIKGKPVSYWEDNCEKPFLKMRNSTKK